MLFGQFCKSPSQCTYWPLMASSGVKVFCFVLNNARPLLPLEMMLLRLWEQEKVSITPSFKSQINILQYPSSLSSTNSMIWSLKSMTSIKVTMTIVKMWRKKLREQFYKYAFPPCTDVCFKGRCWLILCQSVDHTAQRSTLWQICISKKGKYQHQVKVLIERMAFSLDDTLSSVHMCYIGNRIYFSFVC